MSNIIDKDKISEKDFFEYGNSGVAFIKKELHSEDIYKTDVFFFF